MIMNFSVDKLADNIRPMVGKRDGVFVIYGHLHGRPGDAPFLLLSLEVHTDHLFMVFDDSAYGKSWMRNKIWVWNPSNSDQTSHDLLHFWINDADRVRWECGPENSTDGENNQFWDFRNVDGRVEIISSEDISGRWSSSYNQATADTPAFGLR